MADFIKKKCFFACQLKKCCNFASRLHSLCCARVGIGVLRSDNYKKRNKTCDWEIDIILEFY